MINYDLQKIRTIIFDIDAATSGTMKKRGRKKNA